MKSLLSDQRRTALGALAAMPLEVLVIGGGIVGAGMARDAAMRGLRVGLVEQRDFASGTSSRSSRLLHGGLRYLAQGRIALVREASVEKKIISRIAPHLAEPLPFLFPAYRGNKTWGLRRLQIGVKAYDLLCGGRNLGKSTWLNRAETLQRVPDLSADGLTGAIRYYDGFTNDARLVLDTLRSAAKHGAILLNYCKFEDADFHSGRWHCRICDGAGQAPGPSIVQARAVVNACGPWAGGLPHGRVKLRLTKGIHLVVNRSRLAVPEAVVMTEGKRILFVIPWGERIILGTTDTDYDGPLDHVRADGPEIRYILEITNRHFPKAKLGVCDVISSWAGLRPLIAGPDGNPSEISRRHEIRNPEPGWWDVAGGKLTSYRLMAEQALDQIIKSLNPARDSDRKIAPCRTADEPLLPRTETEGVSGILPPQSSRDTVNHHCANEWALHLDDVMVRRTGWHYYFADAAERAGPVADWMGEFLDWPAAVRAEEIERYRATTVFPPAVEPSPAETKPPPSSDRILA